MGTTGRVTDVVIQAVDLRKNFGKVIALGGLDLSVRRGEVHGFLGPNGSGKSSAIRISLGLVRATGGTVRLFADDPWRAAIELHRRLAHVPGDVSVVRLTGGESLSMDFVV
ncbi:ATP-binding cassette domain-containing protein [Dermatophilaceae bacterium Sec6.4]